MKYFKEAQELWRTYVPDRGQADTVQGELIRAIEKLRDEAQRNGNMNWGSDHVILVQYIHDQLVGSDLFNELAVDEIDQDTARLLGYEHPETSDGPFDRLTDRVVEWARAHPQPVPNAHNPNLHR